MSRKFTQVDSKSSRGKKEGRRAREEKLRMGVGGGERDGDVRSDG